MKIVIIGTAYPYRGGLTAFNERLAYEYLAQGHQVEIYTFTLQYPSFLFPGKTQYSDDPAPDGINIYRKINSVNPLNWLITGREIRKKQPDLVVIKFWLPFMAPCFGSIARIIRKNRKTKIVSILDNLVPHEKRIGDRALTKFFVKSVDGFVAMSQSVLADINIFNRQKPRIYSPHPLYDNFGEKTTRKEALEKLGLDENTRYILFFGFIRNYKGLDLLLEAFSDKRLRRNIKLLVAGEFYNNAEQYFALEKELGLQGAIIWANNFIADSDVRYYFGACDLVVQPYKSATQSGVTQIAYHFEKPMLVTNVGGLSEIVPHGEAGYVVEPEKQAVADAMVDFFENKDKETMFIENIKSEKEKFSWAKMTDSIKHLTKIIKR